MCSLLLVCVLLLPSAHEAAGAAGIRRSPRPLWAEDSSKASGASRREDEAVCETISRSNSHFLCVEMDCFACARNDGSNISHSPSSRAKGPLTRNDRVPTSAKKEKPRPEGGTGRGFHARSRLAHHAGA